MDVSINTVRVSQLTRHNIVDAADKYVNRERWKCNLVVYGLPESLESLTTESGSKDTSSFQEVTKNIKVKNAQVIKVSWLDKTQPNKQGPLLVTADSERTKWSILKTAPMLRKVPKWQSVYFSWPHH